MRLFNCCGSDAIHVFDPSVIKGEEDQKLGSSNSKSKKKSKFSVSSLFSLRGRPSTVYVDPDCPTSEKTEKVFPGSLTSSTRTSLSSGEKSPEPFLDREIIVKTPLGSLEEESVQKKDSIIRSRILEEFNNIDIYTPGAKEVKMVSKAWELVYAVDSFFKSSIDEYTYEDLDFISKQLNEFQKSIEDAINKGAFGEADAYYEGGSPSLKDHLADAIASLQPWVPISKSP